MKSCSPTRRRMLYLCIVCRRIVAKKLRRALSIRHGPLCLTRRKTECTYRKRSYFYCWAAACAPRPQGAIMREKVEAQGGVSDPAAGALGTRGVRVLGWRAGEWETPAE